LTHVNASARRPSQDAATAERMGTVMNASDVMTRNVVAVGPDTGVDDIARLLLEHRISGLPVVQGGFVLGIVSEGDLVRRIAQAGAPAPAGWLDLFTTQAARADAFIRSHGRHARDVMTAPAVSVPADMAVAEVAALMERRRLKRVTVVDPDGLLLGIVTRSNLLRALAARPGGATVDDAAIRIGVLSALRRWGEVDPADVLVEDGTVHLWTHQRDRALRRAMVVAAEEVAGVKAVVDHLDSATG
jgi:CBS domain-containing protein